MPREFTIARNIFYVASRGVAQRRLIIFPLNITITNYSAISADLDAIAGITSPSRGDNKPFQPSPINFVCYSITCNRSLHLHPLAFEIFIRILFPDVGTWKWRQQRVILLYLFNGRNFIYVSHPFETRFVILNTYRKHWKISSPPKIHRINGRRRGNFAHYASHSKLQNKIYDL